MVFSKISDSISYGKDMQYITKWKITLTIKGLSNRRLNRPLSFISHSTDAQSLFWSYFSNRWKATNNIFFTYKYKPLRYIHGSYSNLVDDEDEEDDSDY